MLLLIIFVLFFVVMQNRTIKLKVEELIQNYQTNKVEADKKYLNQKLEITGEVKSFLKPDGENGLLELNSTNFKYKLFCRLMNNEVEGKASSLTNGTNVTVIGNCIGLKKYSDENGINEIIIEVEQIK